MGSEGLRTGAPGGRDLGGAVGRFFPSLGGVERSTTETGDVAFSIGVSPSASVADVYFSPRTCIGYWGRGPLIFWGTISTTDTDEPDEEEVGGLLG